MFPLCQDNMEKSNQPMETSDGSLEKTSLGSSFTFVPVVEKLPYKNCAQKTQRTGQLIRESNEKLSAPEARKRESEENNMSGRGVFRAEVVYIKDPEEGKAAGQQRGPQEPAPTQPHKIKLSYKALAAIPTNTLLLDQQAIDDQVERKGELRDSMDRLDKEDTHVEMCSPAQLRQQSEELYAVIDEVLEDPLSMRQPSPALRLSGERGAAKQYSSAPRSHGRETKYATYNLQSPERQVLDASKTKPGVIRPVTSPRLTVEDYDDDDDDVNDEEEYHRNPFTQYMEELSTNNKFEKPVLGSAAGTHHPTRTAGPALSRDHHLSRTAGPAVSREGGLMTGGCVKPVSVSALQITESECSNPRPLPDRGARQRTPVVGTPTKRQMEEPFETHM